MVGMARGAVLSTYLSSWDLATEGSPRMENSTFRNHAPPGYQYHHHLGAVSGLGCSGQGQVEGKGDRRVLFRLWKIR